MGIFDRKSKKEDRVQYSHARTKMFFEAIRAVAENYKADFFIMTVEGQKQFLANEKELIIDTAIQMYGSDFEELRNFRWFVVENEGNAVIYFERK